MVVGREEVAEVARWADGIEQVHECIARTGAAPSGVQRLLYNYRWDAIIDSAPSMEVQWACSVLFV